jgi:YD repeat-containing protein
MSLTIAGTTFTHHHYDPRGDVLYVTVDAYDGPPAHAQATPEGHNVEYDSHGHVVAMTLTNVRWLLERDGELTITLPAGHLTAAELAPVLEPAA